MPANARQKKALQKPSAQNPKPSSEATTKALEYFEVAAERARRHGQANDEALAYELAARACESQGRADFARLVNCDADEVAYTKNVSEGLNAVAAAVDWRDGDNVVAGAGPRAQ